MDQVPVCVAYDKDPTCASDFFTAKPQYINVSGWDNANYNEELVDFIRCVERGAEVPVRYISRGTTPNDIVGW
jgi:adenylosuccinate synthase